MKFTMPKIFDGDEVVKMLEPILKKEKDLLKLLDDVKAAADDIAKYIDDGKHLEPLDTDFSAKVRGDEAADLKELLADMKRRRLTDKWEAEMMRKLGKVKEAADALRKELEKAKGGDKVKGGQIAEPSGAIRYLSSIAIDGRSWIKDVQRAIDLTTSKANKRMAEVEGASEESVDEAASSDTQRMVSRTQTALKELRARPGVTFPFLMCDTRGDLFIFVARDAKGGSAEDKVRAALGEDGKRGQMVRGEVGFVDRKFLFIAQQLGGGTYATRMQRRLLEDSGKRFPIAVGKDKNSLEVVDEDDYKDPLEFLIAQRGPLMDRAKRGKENRAKVYEELAKLGVLETNSAAAKRAKELMDRADAAAERHDMSGFESALNTIRTEVLQSHVRLQAKRLNEKKAFEDEAKKVQGRIPKAQVMFARHIDEMKKNPDATDEFRKAAEKMRQDFDEKRKKLDKAYDDSAKADKEHPFSYEGGWSAAKMMAIEIDGAITAAEDEIAATMDKIATRKKEREKKEADANDKAPAKK